MCVCTCVPAHVFLRRKFVVSIKHLYFIHHFSNLFKCGFYVEVDVLWDLHSEKYT